MAAVTPSTTPKPEPRPADLNLLQLVDPDYATTPDGRFRAYQSARGDWYIRDEQGHYFTGGGSRVASLEIADEYVEAWAEQAGARAAEVAAR